MNLPLPEREGEDVMMWSEKRTCECGYPVTKRLIDDAHSPGTHEQFTYLKHGVYVTGSICPGCGADLFMSAPASRAVK